MVGRMPSSRRALVSASLFALALIGFMLGSVGSAFAAGSISGHVTSKLTGLPVSGVYIMPMRLTPGTSGWLSVSGMTTGADGFYSLAIATEGTYRLSFRDTQGTCASVWYGNSYILDSASNVVVGPGDNVTGVDASLDEPSPSITLHLADGVGGGPVQAQVTPMMRMPNGQWSMQIATIATPDADGNVKVSGLAPGYYLLKVTPTGAFATGGYPVCYYSAHGMGGDPTPVRVLPTQQVVGCDMVMSPADASITGHVSDAAGSAVSGVRVACSTRLAGQDLLVATVTSMADGSFTVPRLLAGPYKLDFTPSNTHIYAVDSMPATAGTGIDYVKQMPASSSMSGTVTVGPDGATKSGLLVRAWEYVNGVSTGYMLATSTLADGSYKLYGLKPADYHLMVTNTAGDYAAGTYPSGAGAARGLLGEPITVTAGSDTTRIDVALVPAAHITGRIVDATTGDPVGILSVRCYQLLRGQWVQVGRIDAATQPDGTYDVTSLNEGTYRVRFFDNNGRYADRYYNESGSVASIDAATNIHVDASGLATGIDGQMGGASPGETRAEMSVSTTGAPGEVTLSSDATQTDGLTVAFADAGLGGTVSASPIDLVETPAPDGVTVLGTVIDISTTALYDGSVQITMPYDESAVVGPESGVKMYHYVDGAWVDATTSVDTTNNTVTGVTTSLSPIAQVVSQTLPKRMLSYLAGPGGSIVGSLTQSVTYGSPGSEVRAVPAPGYHFVTWSDGSTANPRRDAKVTMDHNVSAVFAFTPLRTRLSITSNKVTAFRGRTVVFSGAISPRMRNGTHVVVRIRRSGSRTWTTLSTRGTFGSCHWSYNYKIPKTHRRGTYYVRASYSGSPTYVSCTSGDRRLVIK